MFWKRLLISYLLVILIALSFLGYIVFNQINTNLVDQVINSNKIILENGSNILSDFMIGMKKLILDIAVNDKLQYNLSRFNNGLPIISYHYMNQIIYENQYINDELNKNYAKLKIYPIKHGTVFNYYEFSGSYLPLQEKEENSYIFNTYKKNGGFISTSLYEQDSNYLAITSLVFDMNDWKEPIAVIELKISATAIWSLLYNIKLERNISPYIIDGDGKVFLPYLDYIKLDKYILAGNSEEVIEIDGQIYLMENIASTNWKIMGILPEDTISDKTKGVLKSFIYTGILTILVLIFLSVYLANWLSNPLKRLARRLKSFESGEFKKLIVRKWYSTEVKILYEQYNYMLERINNLIQEVYEAAAKEKDAELLALQAQINPHFLYNTLDSINWMAMRYKAEDIRYMVNKLANMMRYSLNSGKNFITVADEIEQVRNYVGIQEVRYNSKFKTYFEIEDDLEDYKIIKLLLQPLVENAIKHGFAKTGEHGDILIRGYKENECIVFEVINEGDQLDLEKVKALLHPQNDKKQKSYGIRNVNDRLVKQYGEKFELKFFTLEGKTHARIDIPMTHLEKGDSYE